MNKNYSIFISVFADNQMTDCLSSYSDTGIIKEIEYDELDGDDFWQNHADRAEADFNGKWSKIFIRSEQGRNGRVITRNYYLTGETDGDDFVYHDKLFLIGKSTSENISAYFSGHIIFNYRYEEVKATSYYHKGLDEQIITLIKSFINSELVSPLDERVVDVVYNPNSQSIIAMKLADHYEFMIHLPTKEKVNELIGLDKAYESADIIRHVLSDARNIADVYSTKYLDFTKPWLAEIEDKIIQDSEDSFVNIFKNRFCV